MYIFKRIQYIYCYFVIDNDGVWCVMWCDMVIFYIIFVSGWDYKSGFFYLFEGFKYIVFVVCFFFDNVFICFFFDKENDI